VRKMMSGRGAGATAEPRQQRKMIKMCTDMTPAMTQKMMQHGAAMQGDHGVPSAESLPAGLTGGPGAGRRPVDPRQLRHARRTYPPGMSSRTQQ
jgi:hypothetical protein